MTAARNEQIRGRRLAMAPLNGLPSGGGYKYRKFEAWSPENGVWLNEAEALRREGAEAYEGRLAAYADMVAQGMHQHEIALRLEVSDSTVSQYALVLRKRAAMEAAR